MRQYTVFYKTDNGEQKSWRVKTTDRFKAKWLAMDELGIHLSQIIDVL
jgi:hypothetical protein